MPLNIQPAGVSRKEHRVSDPKEWVTIKEAALLVGRDQRQVYRWVKQGRLATRLSTHGVLQVLSKAAIRVESEVKRGRPTGTVSGGGRWR